MESRTKVTGLLILLLIAAVSISVYVYRGRLAAVLPQPAAGETLSAIDLPEGFRISVYADDVPNARSMVLSPGGVLFVGTRDQGKVFALRDRDEDFVAEERFTIAAELLQPNGVAFYDGALYVAEINRILKFESVERALEKPPAPVVVSADYPRDEHHGWKFVRFGPDGMLYVPVGAPCNVCNPTNPIYATITRINPDGSYREIFARGVRNSVGFDWHPESGELWFTDNGRDWMGDDSPPDELNHAPRPDMHFGFPYCHGTGIPDPDHNQDRDCAEFVAPALELGPHVAALGMRFYTGSQFPEKYRGGIFIAEHGSWNRSEPIGYRVMFVSMENGRPLSYEVFAEGWLGGGVAWGRPVDVELLPDGSMLVSDDKAGKIYRIRYE